MDHSVFLRNLIENLAGDIGVGVHRLDIVQIFELVNQAKNLLGNRKFIDADQIVRLSAETLPDALSAARLFLSGL